MLKILQRIKVLESDSNLHSFQHSILQKISFLEKFRKLLNFLELFNNFKFSIFLESPFKSRQFLRKPFIHRNLLNPQKDFLRSEGSIGNCMIVLEPFFRKSTLICARIQDKHHFMNTFYQAWIG